LSTHRPSFRRAFSAALLVMAVAIGAALVPATAGATSSGKVRAMTRNIYLGADLVPALQAPNTVEVFEAAGDIYRGVQDTNFTARAKVLANEIADTNPDLIGLQEVAIWRRGENGVFDGLATPSREVVYNFLDELRHELHKANLDYRVAVKQVEADFELPIDFVDDDTLNPKFEARLTMRDVILVKKGLETSNADSQQYGIQLPVDLPPIGPCPFTCGPEDIFVPRGWTSVDLVKGGTKLRFVNTHLEAFYSPIRVLQAQELAADGGPLDTSRHVILAGDLNSDPNIPDGISPEYPDHLAYDQFITDGEINGFVDRGVDVSTCCHDADLLDAGGQFDLHIDHILVKPDMDLANAKLVGDDPANRTPHLLWPSDHGGVVSTFNLP
jgi:endonuclease/exonuclease/phosphatase family protein